MNCLEGDYGKDTSHCQHIMGRNIHIGERLREERKRLKLNQTDFSSIGGTTRRTQSDYEKGSGSPDADYLSDIAKEGADVQYILTGIRWNSALKTSDLKNGEENRVHENNAMKTDSYGKPDGESLSQTLRPTLTIEVEPTELQWLSWYRQIPDDEKPMVEAVVKRFADNVVEEEDREGEVG